MKGIGVAFVRGMVIGAALAVAVLVIHRVVIG